MTIKIFGLSKIYFVERNNDSKWEKPRLFSKNLKTHVNDGPVSFNNKFDTIFYSRNIKIEPGLSDMTGGRNNLGIFYAVLKDNKWTKIHELRINKEWYNVTTPCLSSDSKTLYFASDKPGGYGGSDLYFCLWKGYYWGDPVNMGPVINTPGNESYPFINSSGEFFFSSDGHPGLGGKDIFFSRLEDGEWITPIRLDSPINSKFDDIGIITDTLMSEGYFSSNRDNTFDIYHFKTNIPQILYNSIQREDQYCFTIEDSSSYCD